MLKAKLFMKLIVGLVHPNFTVRLFSTIRTRLTEQFKEDLAL
jgi:hypothetical protein